jgi:hypothetical protein
MFDRPVLNLLTLLVVILLSGAPQSVSAAVNTDQSESTTAPGRYEIRDHRPKGESIFDITFGSPPPLATERGILIIDAFNDLNNNQRQDENELPLAEDISCRLGDIDYLVPAFIPGLEYNDSYSITCSGRIYQPTQRQPEVFIEKRGQIIHLNIPCRTQLPNSGADTE